MQPLPAKLKRSLAFVALLGACGGRIDTPPPPPPSTDFAGCDASGGVGRLTPKVMCVGAVDGRSFAVLGYENASDGVVHVPIGASNQLVVSTPVAWDGRGSPTPPTAFLPGSHPAAVAVPYAGSLTWTLGGTLVDVTGASTCDVSGSGSLASLGIGSASVRLSPIDPSVFEPTVAPDAPLNGAAVGVVGGQLAISPTGAATYQIPIPIPAGRQGMEPGISLDYNSQSGNGIAGVGWNLHATSVIAPCERSVHAAKAMPHRATSTFCLDGAPLYQDPTTTEEVFRPEHAPLVRITRTTSENGPTTRWVVQHPDGQRQFFERVAADEIYPLLLTMDSVGNSMRFQYTLPGGQVELASIHYTYDASLVARRHVYFTYEVRPDEESTLAAPQPRRTRRLTSIRSTVEGPSGEETFREHRLAYVLSESSGRSLLASVTECESHGVCKKPLTLSYSDGRPTGTDYAFEGKVVGTGAAPTAPFVPLTAPTSAEGQARYNLVWGDFDGDGRLDALAYAENGIGPSTKPGWCLMRGQADGSMSGCVEDAGVPVSTFGKNRGPSPVPVDWDLDGRMDLAVPIATDTWSTEWRYDLYRADDTGHFAPLVTSAATIIGGPSQWEPILFADTKDDAYHEVFNGKDRKVSTLVVNNGFKQKFFATTKHPNTVVDVEGDGFFEILEDTPDKSTTPEWFTLFRSGSCGVSPIDGMSGECSGGEKIPRPSTLTTWSFRQPSPRLPLRRLGSGRVDWLFWASSAFETGKANAMLRFTPSGKSAGMAFVAPPTGLPHVVAPVHDDLTRYAWATVGDIDGDGLDDIVLPVPRPTQQDRSRLELRIFRNKATTQSDLLAGVDNGLGDQSTVHYSAFREKVPEPGLQDGECAMPVGCYVRDVWVADAYAVHTQPGGPKRSFTMSYAKPRVDLNGGGFLGFKSVSSRDEQTGATATTTYDWMAHRVGGFYPYTKSPTRHVTRVPLSVSPVRWQEDTTEITYTPLTIGLVSSALQTSVHVVTVERRGAVEETLADQTETFAEYDAYGNPALHTVRANLAGVTLTTRTTHKNLVSRWILGLPERTEATSDAGAIELLFPGKGRGTRTVVNEFDADGLVVKTTREPDGSPDLKLVVEYERNGYGQPLRIRATDATGRRRETRLVYDAAESIFVTGTIDSLGHRRATA